MNSFISGAVAMASLVAALFFLRFWRQTRDRFFLLFSLAFALDALTRLVLAMIDIAGEQEPFYYLARLAMFGLIILAIIDKNRTARWP
jgi:hypothetical protein